MNRKASFNGSSGTHSLVPSFIETAKYVADCKTASSIQPLAYLTTASAASEINS